MSVAVWWDNRVSKINADGGNPAQVISGLAGKLDATVCGSVKESLKGLGAKKYCFVPKGSCIFMSGTTGDLTKALTGDRQDFELFLAPDDSFSVRYLRQKIGLRQGNLRPETRTVVGLGGHLSYWTQPLWQRDVAHQKGGWAELRVERGEATVLKPFKSECSVVRFDELIKRLEDARGQDAWF